MSTSTNEGDTVSLSVPRVGGSLGPISISYATIAGTATTSDFTTETGELTWADGDSADKIITIDTTGDATTEPDESFTVQLGTPIGDTSLSYAGAASVTINNLSPIQSWRLTNFGNTANSGTGANDADFDFDSITNLMEYALKRSPTSGIGTDGLQALPTETMESTDPLLAERLTLICNIPDPAMADVDYLVEITSTLVSGGWMTLATKSGTGAWVWLAGGTARIIENSNAGRTTVEIGDSGLQSGSTKRFTRLRVSQ